MSYFNNLRTEEELKDQYRKLLNKYDYRNPQNAKLLNDIRKEYEETLMKIKRANGYRTPLEKVADSAKNFVKGEINDYKTAKAAEKERVDRLKNHKYTKEEFVDSFNQVKYYLGLVIEELVTKKDDFDHVIILEHINKLDDIALYQWFNAQNYIFTGNPGLMKEYNSAREVLEYSILSISGQTKTENEENLIKMEGLLGKFFKEQYRKCCDELLDPIDVAKHEMLSHQRIKENAIGRTMLCVMVVWMLIGFPCFVIFCLIGNDILLTVGTLLTFFLAFWIGSAISKKIGKASKSTTFSTFASVEKARVTQEKKYQQDYDNRKGFIAILRLILSFIKF